MKLQKGKEGDLFFFEKWDNEADASITAPNCKIELEFNIFDNLFSQTFYVPVLEKNYKVKLK